MVYIAIPSKVLTFSVKKIYINIAGGASKSEIAALADFSSKCHYFLNLEANELFVTLGHVKR